MSEPDPGTLYVQDGVLYGNAETQKAWKEALKGSSRISAILHIIMNNSINKVCGSATEYLLKVIIKTLKLDTRTVSSRVDFILFYWLWRFFNMAI